MRILLLLFLAFCGCQGDSTVLSPEGAVQPPSPDQDRFAHSDQATVLGILSPNVLEVRYKDQKELVWLKHTRLLNGWHYDESLMWLQQHLPIGLQIILAGHEDERNEENHFRAEVLLRSGNLDPNLVINLNLVMVRQGCLGYSWDDDPSENSDSEYLQAEREAMYFQRGMHLQRTR